MRTNRLMLKEVRRALLVALGFSGCINLLMLAMPVFTLQVFETVVPTGSIETLVMLSAIAGTAILVLALLELVRDRILVRAGLWLDHVLGQHLLENGLKAGLAPGEMRLDAKALSTLRTFITSPAVHPLFDVPWVPLFLAGLALLHPLIGLAGALTAVLLLMAGLLQSLATGTIQTEAQRALERSEQWWLAVAGRAQVWGALGLAAGAREQWEAFNRTHVAAAYSLGKRQSVVRAFARTVRTGAQIGIYAIGAWLVIKGELSPGALVASAILLSRALAPFEQLVPAFRAAGIARAAYQRLKAHAPDAVVPEVVTEADLPTGRLRLADVAYYYPSRRTPALHGISLDLEPGESMAIVGPNGSGKSTLAQLMAGASVPHVGTVELDGLSVAKWQRGDCAPPVGYLPDDPALVEGTVHENIARFRGATLISVARAAMRVGVHEIISRLPHGYDTFVGPGGDGLALRERRAVAFARALYGKPLLVVLDEPEIGLDGGSVRQLVKVLGELKGAGIGLVIATQDQRLLALADRIALLGEGTLQVFGAAADVLRRIEVQRATRPAPVQVNAS